MLSAILLSSHETELIGLSINYPGRPRGEIRASRSLAQLLPFSTIIEVSIDTGDRLTMPLTKQGQFEGWIPHRNLLFWTIAANKAVCMNIDFIAAGHNKEDGNLFNDVSEEFFHKLKQIFRYSGNENLQHPLAIELPMMTAPEKGLRDIIKTERILNLLKDTWSCWRDSNTHCGECYACMERRAFFQEIALDH